MKSFGPFLKITDPAIVEIMAFAGFNHVVIDMEHGPISYERAQDLVRTAQLRGITPMIRVQKNDETMILRALDIGAHGVHIPHISTVEDARKAVSACFFHPIGDRGVCRYVRAADYTSCEKAEHFSRANESVIPILHIEGKEGLANLPEILKVEGIGIIFIGPYDLSQSCGVPGEVKHELVLEHMRQACEIARQHNVSVGTFVDDPESATFWRNLGVDYICISVDVGIIMEAASSICKKVG